MPGVIISNNSGDINHSDTVSKIVEEFLRDKNVKSFKAEITGTTEKGDNFCGDIIFVKLEAYIDSKITSRFDLVIKCAKSDQQSRENIPIIIAYEREIHLYTKVMPFLRKLELEKSIQQPFNSVPKCYKTFSLNNSEYLILENLKNAGYRMYDKQKPVTWEHLKLVVQEYGKWHALSFVARDQKNKEFAELTQDWKRSFEQFVILPGMAESYNKGFETICRILKENHEFEMLNQFKDDFKEPMHKIIHNLIQTEEPNWVISHGDCWINNFLFKYKDSESTIPTQVAILDWQLSDKVSPVMDLYYFLYSSSSGEELKHLDELLKLYYHSLTNRMRELGSDPKQLFPVEEFKRHWMKYNKYPVTFMPILLQMVLSSKEEGFSAEDIPDDSSFGAMLSSLKTNDVYDKRILDIIKHHYTFKFPTFDD